MNDEVKPLWIEQKLGPYWGLILVGIVVVPLVALGLLVDLQSAREQRELENDPAMKNVRQFAKEQLTEETTARQE
jgi:hypothetical protein